MSSPWARMFLDRPTSIALFASASLISLRIFNIAIRLVCCIANGAFDCISMSWGVRVSSSIDGRPFIIVNGQYDVPRTGVEFLTNTAFSIAVG